MLTRISWSDNIVFFFFYLTCAIQDKKPKENWTCVINLKKIMFIYEQCGKCWVRFWIEIQSKAEGRRFRRVSASDFRPMYNETIQRCSEVLSRLADLPLWPLKMCVLLAFLTGSLLSSPRINVNLLFDCSQPFSKCLSMIRLRGLNRFDCFVYPSRSHSENDTHFFFSINFNQWFMQSNVSISKLKTFKMDR